MNFESFDREFAILMNFFKKEGFHKNPSEFEKTLYAKLMSYSFEVRIIASRLEEETPNFDALSRVIFQSMNSKKKPDELVLERFVMTFATIMLDLSDFYIYTRIFIDALIVSIKRSFRSAGNKNWVIMKNSVSGLLSKKKLQTYKDKIDFQFFKGLEKKVAWVHEFKRLRDKLTHQYSLFVFATTRKGKLGYDMVDGNETWGRETVTEIFEGLQNTIDHLSNLMEYLSRNLPRTQ